MPYTYLYRGATSEDVLQEKEDNYHAISLESLARPECSFVATAYSRELINSFAHDLWSEIEPEYCKNDGELLNWDSDIRECISTHVPQEGDVKEVVIHQYFIQGRSLGGPIIQIVVKKHAIRQPANRARTLAEILPDFDKAPGDSG